MRASRLALQALFALLFAFTLEAQVPTYAQAKKPGSPAVKSPEELDNLRALNLRVMNLYRSGSYREAGRAAEELVVAVRERYGDKGPAYAEALLLLGQMFRHQARYDDAEPLMRRALEIYESTSKPDDASVASTLIGLGQVLWRTHRLAERRSRAPIEPLQSRKRLSDPII